MNNRDSEHSVFVSILNRGKASKMLKEAKKLGASGGTIAFAYGTVDDELLHFLELYEVKKEILLMVVDDELNNKLHDELGKKFNLNKRNKGIAFSLPVTALAGMEDFLPNKKEKDGSSLDMEYEAIFVVVEKHKGEKVIDTAKKYGSTGATIIPGRGSGIHEKGSIFNIVIEPEKEIVLMIVEKDKTNDIIDGIKKDLDITEPTKGIVFSVGVNRITGLMEQNENFVE